MSSSFTKIILLIFIFISGIRNFAQSEIDENEWPFDKPKNGNTYVIAHRGVHIGIPENTISAYKQAIALGCDFIEIDIRRTKDGKFVSVHNSTIDAYVDSLSGKVSDFTLAELKQMNIGKRIDPIWENERIPTFEEILMLCKNKIGIYLDLKEPYVKELIEIIKNYEMEESIVWYIPTSYIDAIKEVKNNCKKCLPMPDPGPIENVVSVVEEINPSVIATDMGELSKEYMTAAQNYNVRVFVDEKNGDKKEWEKLLEFGVDGIQTDNPEKLIEYIKNQ